MPKPLDLKSSLNLPRTAFPMKAGLPQNEPKMLAEWEQSGPLCPHPAGPRRRPDLRPARRAALSHRHHPPRHRPQQDPEGHGREIQDHGGLPRPVRPRAGTATACRSKPRSKRNWAARKAACRRQNSAASAASSPCVTWTCTAATSSAWASSAAGSVPYLTMDPHHEAIIAGAFVDFLEKGYVYRGPQARVLVHPRPHRAGRSRSRIRGSHQPVHLGALSGG